MNILCAFKFFLILFPQSCPDDQEDNSLLLLNSLPQFLMSAASETINLPNTAKNPFVFLEENNYYYENHTVTTEDGYILLTVRIPYGKRKVRSKKRPPVIFLHGIFCTFYDFLNAGPEKAIGFQILEEGYDLWLLNSRGNTHSRQHVTLDPVLNASAYWNFSWHEIAYYDVPANMDYIEKVTGFPNVSVVGHSQGGTVYMALAASRPEYDRRITFSLQLAPVVYLKNAKQIVVRTLKDNIDILDALIRKYEVHEVLSSNEFFLKIGQLCYINSPYLPVCDRMVQVLSGPSDQLDSSLLSILAYNHPAGSSAKQIVHFVQVAATDRFQLYDYGPHGNKKAYNQASPPLYNLSAITSPVAIYYGKDDFFVSLIDGARMVAQIPNALPFVLGRNTNHMDVQWGSRATQNIFRPGIRLLNKYNRKYK